MEVVIQARFSMLSFIATLRLRINEEFIEVDCRPSDALAIAVRTKVAIFVEEAVLAKAAVLLDEEGNPVTSEDEAPEVISIGDDELKRLSAFADFIEELDLDEDREIDPLS